MLQMCLYFECLLVVELGEPRRGADLSGCAASEPVQNLLVSPMSAIIADANDARADPLF